MELLAETRNVAPSEGGPSRSRPSPAGRVVKMGQIRRVNPFIRLNERTFAFDCTTRITIPKVSMELDSDSDDGSGGEYIGDTDKSSGSSFEAKFVAEMQHVCSFLLITSAAIPDLASVSSHFQTLNLDTM
ncbi:hypothetical protein PIB30_034258 [Stylosanthes scabra]|uniref:Uncharacterized protein n=1 Tax=Stylosanthes scabra TaxID=79078 RepID=A0ABU6WCH2_9FABA|nr:hypothetical protein [Stylosanthes scabra]